MHRTVHTSYMFCMRVHKAHTAATILPSIHNIPAPTHNLSGLSIAWDWLGLGLTFTSVPNYSAHSFVPPFSHHPACVYHPHCVCNVYLPSWLCGVQLSMTGAESHPPSLPLVTIWKVSRLGLFRMQLLWTMPDVVL